MAVCPAVRYGGSMRRHLMRHCETCNSECTVRLKVHYLGIHYVEECKCGTRLCSDPHGINWRSYVKKEKKVI
ncbi:MAG: hypothetical protein ACRC6V_02240 [Bacteroidales bacterium]